MRGTFLLGLFFTAVAFGAPPRATFVLVHGALFTSSGWMKAQSVLQNHGYNVVTLDVPGRAGDDTPAAKIDIRKAADKVCQVVRLQDGPVVLVGHSQGGALITQALGGCADGIKALVYVAAVLPLNGETAFQGLDPAVDVNFGKCVDVDARAGLFRVKASGPLYSSFFQDLPADEAAKVVHTMVDEPIGIGTTVLGFPQDKFDGTPKFYVEALQDQVVSLTTQRRLQARVSLRKVYSMDTSHSPFLSRPGDFAKILEEIEAGL